MIVTKNTGSGLRMLGFKTLLSFTSYRTISESLELFVLWFYHLQNGDNGISHYKEPSKMSDIL